MVRSHKRRGRRLWILKSFLFTVATVFVVPTYAQSSDSRCRELVDFPSSSLETLRSEAYQQIAEIESITPRRDFVFINQERQVERPGYEGLTALRELLPPGARFQAAPAPNTESEDVVKLLNSENAFPVHLEVPFQGESTQTTLWVSLPALTDTNATPQYIVGPENERVFFHVHGGGTPTASGVNGMSIASYMNKRGVPVIAPDMPGHMNGPLNPITEAVEILRWAMAIINQTVHPDVKVVFSGHSWGGEFAAILHRLSRLPEFSRIDRIISLSPPVDTSLGGSAEERAEFEKWFKDNLAQFEDQIAETDYDFLVNLVVNGKISPIASWYTDVTSMDYSLPPLSPEQMAELKPLQLIVGSADGLVYVGRERFFEQAFGSLPEPSEYVVLGPGLNFKSKSEQDLQPTGHNIFDRYIEGTTTPETYTRMLNFALERFPTDQTDFSDLEQSLNQRLSAIGEGGQRLHRIFLNYANNFVFRRYLESYVGFIQRPNSTMEEVVSQKRNLERFLSQVQGQIKKFEDGGEKAFREALAAYAEQVGANAKMTLEKAQWELSLPGDTPARRAELQTYLDEVSRRESEFRAQYQDPFAEKLQSILSQYRVESKAAGQEELRALEKTKPLSNEQRERKSELSRFVQAYSEVEKRSSQALAQALEQVLSEVARPEGVEAAKFARRELQAYEEPTGRDVLTAFIEGYPTFVERFQQNRQTALEEILAGITDFPEGVSSIEQARGLLDIANARLRDLYVPEGRQDVEELVARRQAFEEQLRALNDKGNPEGPDRIGKNLIRLLGERSKIVKSLLPLWEMDDWTNPAVAEALSLANSKIEALVQAHERLDEGRSEYLMSLRQAGQLTAQNVVDYPESVDQLTMAFSQAQQEYLAALREYKRVIFSEALHGRLDEHQETLGLNQAPSQLLQRLVGDVEFLETRQASEGSLEYEIQQTRSALMTALEVQSRLMRAIQELRYEYSQLVEDSVYRVERIEARSLFDLSLADLQAQMQDPDRASMLNEYMKTLLSEWDSLWSPVLQEEQFKSFEADIIR